MPGSGGHTETTNSQVRQLAAIMFADMTGYTAMMQEDEQHAKILRDRQKHTLENLIPAYNGKIIQYFGDGTLSIFDSAINAVLSGIEIQKELQLFHCGPAKLFLKLPNHKMFRFEVLLFYYYLGTISIDFLIQKMRDYQFH